MPVGAQCTTTKDASAVLKSAKLVASCNYKRIRRGPDVTCKTSPPPACAQTLVGYAMALAWGSNNPAVVAVVDPRGLRDQLKVKTISTGVVNFIGKSCATSCKGCPRPTPKQGAILHRQDSQGVRRAGARGPERHRRA
jgi:hypothetical protein